MSSFFAKCEAKFPAVEGGDVDLMSFIKAAEVSLPPFFGGDMMGKEYKLVKDDLEGNVKKLQAQYEKHQHKTVKTMLEFEIENKTNTEDKSGTVALLWLKRGMQFSLEFLQQMLNDESKSESLSAILKAAYENTLSKHHNFVGRGAFKVISGFALKRPALMTKIAGAEEYDEAQVISDTKAYLDDMSACVTAIQAMYDERSLDK